MKTRKKKLSVNTSPLMTKHKTFARTESSAVAVVGIRRCSEAAASIPSNPWRCSGRMTPEMGPAAAEGCWRRLGRVREAETAAWFWRFRESWAWRDFPWTGAPPRRTLWRRPPPSRMCRAKLWRLCVGPLFLRPICPTAFGELLCIFFFFRRFLRRKGWRTTLVAAVALPWMVVVQRCSWVLQYLYPPPALKINHWTMQIGVRFQ